MKSLERGCACWVELFPCTLVLGIKSCLISNTKSSVRQFDLSRCFQWQWEKALPAFLKVFLLLKKTRKLFLWELLSQTFVCWEDLPGWAPGSQSCPATWGLSTSRGAAVAGRTLVPWGRVGGPWLAGGPVRQQGLGVRGKGEPPLPGGCPHLGQLCQPRTEQQEGHLPGQRPPGTRCRPSRKPVSSSPLIPVPWQGHTWLNVCPDHHRTLVNTATGDVSTAAQQLSHCGLGRREQQAGMRGSIQHSQATHPRQPSRGNRGYKFILDTQHHPPSLHYTGHVPTLIIATLLGRVTGPWRNALVRREPWMGGSVNLPLWRKP